MQIPTDTKNHKEFLFKDLTYKINGCLFAVHNELGRFARERQFGDLLEIKLTEAGICFKREVRVSDTGNIIDFIIEDVIVLELKAKPFLTREDYYQTQRYLQILNLRLGILVNFRTKYLTPKRILNSKANL